MRKRSKARLSAAELDRRFDEGEDIARHLDASSARRMAPRVHRFNVDLPQWAVSALDNAATRRGIARQALVKTWLVEQLDNESKNLIAKKAR
jgi:hypothetical protein